MIDFYSLTYYLLYLAFPFQTKTDEEDKGAAMIENNNSGSELGGGDEKIIDPETVQEIIPVRQSPGINDADRKTHRFWDIV
jgi:hypothetical protein